jgi:hypothetical protein
LVATLALAGCRDKGALPDGLAGSFVPQDALFREIRVHLNVTKAGLTVTRYGVGVSGSLTFDGKPLARGSAEAGTGGAALFASLRCETDVECRFTTKSGCEGSISGDGKGNVVLIADGECSAWSGKWMAEKEGAPRPSAAPAPSPPPVPTMPPVGTAAPVPTTPPVGTAAPVPTTPPAGSAGPKDTFRCMKDCSHTHTACVHQCRFGDSACFSRCGDEMSACVDRCD